MQAGVADAFWQLCPVRRAGAWASTAFRALQNALGSVAPSGGACGVLYTPAPDLSGKARRLALTRHVMPAVCPMCRCACPDFDGVEGVPLQKVRRWNKIKKMCRAAARPMQGKEASKRC